MNEVYSSLPDSILCGFEGKIILTKKIFSKPECFDIYSVLIQGNEGIIDSKSIDIKNIKCFEENLHQGIQYIDIKSLPKYKDIIIGEKIALTIQETDAYINQDKAYKVFPIENPLKENDQWKVPLNSVINSIYNEKIDNFSRIPTCGAQAQESSPIFIWGVLIILLVGVVFGIVVCKKLRKKKSLKMN